MGRPGRAVGAILGVAALGILLAALPAASHLSAADSNVVQNSDVVQNSTVVQNGTVVPDSRTGVSADSLAQVMEAQPSAVEQAPAPLATTAPPAAPIVVAIGDSIMSGHGLDDPAQSWPELLAARNGWQLTDLADDGTGFVQPGDNDDTFQNQADVAVHLDPSIVIIAASNNDLGVDSSELADQTTSTLQSLRAALPEARIIALSAFWGDETPPDELQEATDDIHDAADAVGATFVDIGQPLSGQPDLMQDDDVHPTADGQEVLATEIGSDISGALAGG
ncbi:MAG: acyl-CoA thioesterase [Subtercola sp.]|nr:acyl-CoA thioesterase [Subtercola sp.]